MPYDRNTDCAPDDNARTPYFSILKLSYLKGIFISYSKNVVTQRKEKADEICPYKNCSICKMGCSISELLCKDIKYLTECQVI